MPHEWQHSREEPLLRILEILEEYTVATLDDLDAAVATLQAQDAVNKQLLTDLLTAVTASGVNDARIEAAVANINAVSSGEAADDTAAQAGLTPTPAAAPVDPNAPPVDPNAPPA